MKDFFISYNSTDKSWAEWIAWRLEEAGYTTVIQAWDFRPGANFVLEMQRAATEAERTIAVLSNNYFRSQFTPPEWVAAFVQDPTGEKGLLVPVRVEECHLTGLWPAITYIDLVGKDEEDAKGILLTAVQRVRGKPTHPPPFPGEKREPKPYPESDADGRWGGIKKYFQRLTGKWVRNLISRKIKRGKARLELLDKMRAVWIEGVREEMEAPVGAPLDVRISLGEEPGGETLAHEASAPHNTAEQDVCALFDDADHLLLILGGPGTGKTFKLIELLECLLKRAKDDATVPIPVIFNLSSWADWADGKRPMRDWLISELMSVYGLSHGLAQYWVDGQDLALLLDGLDEITAGGAETDSVGHESARRLSVSCRRRCLNEINNYVAWSGIWLALCCREEEYVALDTRLYTRRKNSTARIVPLTKTDVDTYLNKAGLKLKSLCEAMSVDQTLREMARTPFLLRIMSIAYREQPGISAKGIVEGGRGGEDARRKDLFEKYVDARYHHHAESSLRRQYSRLLRIRDYLGELAEKMEQGDSKLFLVDQLQPNPVWLSPRDRWLYRLLVALLLILFFWVLVGLPAGWSLGYEWAAHNWVQAVHPGVTDPPMAPIAQTLWKFNVEGMFWATLICGSIVAVGFLLSKGWGFGIACGLAFGVTRAIIARDSPGATLRDWMSQGLASAALGIIVLVPIMHLRDHKRDHICPIERSTLHARRALLGTCAAVIVGAVLGAILIPILGLNYGLPRGLAFGSALIPVFALSYGYLSTSVKIKTHPNQGTRHSAFTALWTALWSTLVGTLCFGLAYGAFLGPQQGIVNAILGLSLGVTSLVFGAMPLMQHLSLRLVLYLRGIMPLRLVRFLNAANTLHLLRRVGGGYVFQHEYLRKYFRDYHRSKAK